MKFRQFANPVFLWRRRVEAVLLLIYFAHLLFYFQSFFMTLICSFVCFAHVFFLVKTCKFYSLTCFAAYNDNYDECIYAEKHPLLKFVNIEYLSIGFPRIEHMLTWGTLHLKRAKYLSLIRTGNAIQFTHFLHVARQHKSEYTLETLM